MAIGDAVSGGVGGALGGAAVGAGVGAAVAAIPLTSGIATAVTGSFVGQPIIGALGGMFPVVAANPVVGAAVVTGSVLAAAGLAMGAIGGMNKPKWTDRINAERAAMAQQGMRR